MLALVKTPPTEVSLNGPGSAAVLSALRRVFGEVQVIGTSYEDSTGEEVLEIRDTDWWQERDVNRAGHLLAGSRLKLGMTQAQLAAKTGFTASVISAYENGRRPISMKAALRLAPVLELDPKELGEGDAICDANQ